VNDFLQTRRKRYSSCGTRAKKFGLEDYHSPTIVEVSQKKKLKKMEAFPEISNSIHGLEKKKKKVS
jgi:hypothetical protein